MQCQLRVSNPCFRVQCWTDTISMLNCTYQLHIDSFGARLLCLFFKATYRGTALLCILFISNHFNSNAATILRNWRNVIKSGLDIFKACQAWTSFCAFLNRIQFISWFGWLTTEKPLHFNGFYTVTRHSISKPRRLCLTSYTCVVSGLKTYGSE